MHEPDEALQSRIEAPDAASTSGYHSVCVRPEHIALARRLRTSENPISAGPAFDEKRPWGNSSVECDVIEILEGAGFIVPRDPEDETRDYELWTGYASELLAGLGLAIDVGLSTGSFAAGWYRKPRVRGGRWDGDWKAVDPAAFAEPEPVHHFADTAEDRAFLRSLEAKDAGSETFGYQAVHVRPEHLLLLRNANVSDSSYTGAPGLDPKRPFGDSWIEDSMMALLLPDEWAVLKGAEDEQEMERLMDEYHGDLHRLLGELAPVLQLGLDTFRFEEGFFRKPRYGPGEWTKTDFPSGRKDA